MRYLNKIVIVSALALLCSLLSCSGVKKQVAIDDLVGTYKGKPVCVLQLSKLNLGLEDQQVDSVESEFIMITKDKEGNLSLKFDDGAIVKINNINMATNGAVFNIPSQEFTLKDDGAEMNGTIAGLSENLFGESKCDGFYDSDKNKMSFSFSGTILFEEDGNKYNVPIAVGYYEFVKQN